jgi:16S rRNA (adenine1518-N6/adenine1519-N6)-dimethyltransferase
MRCKPKKSLGQNFLIDRNIQRKIIQSCAFQPQDTVLEIGAGRGELTGLIADKVNKIYALEIDPSLCSMLKVNFKDCPKVKIINQDILKFNLNRLFLTRDSDYLFYPRKREKGRCPYYKKTRLKVIGNIPYYITSPIIERLLKFKDNIEVIFLTVQKEFAQRIIAHPGTKAYGAFSCFVQYYLEPKVIFEVKKGCFFPQPKVDSCFIRLKVRPQPLVTPKDEQLFFKVIRAAFNQRRKTLRNSLKGVILPQKLELFFQKYGLNNNIRPEGLSLADFANLATSILPTSKKCLTNKELYATRYAK